MNDLSSSRDHIGVAYRPSIYTRASRCTATAPTSPGSTRRTNACGPMSTATAFNDYRHRVYANYRGVVYPLPINLGTINQFFGAAYCRFEARAHRAAGRRNHGRTGQPRGRKRRLDRSPALRDAFIADTSAKQADRPARAPLIITRSLRARFHFLYEKSLLP